MIEFEPLFELQADVAPPRITSDGPYGTRRFIPVTGDSFHGARVSGKLLPGGAGGAAGICPLVTSSAFRRAQSHR